MSSRVTDRSSRRQTSDMLPTDVQDHRVRRRPFVTCAEVLDLLTDDAEGVLRGEVRAALAQHLSTCASCSASRRLFEEMSAVIREQTDATMTDEARERLRQYLATKTRPT